MYELRPKYWIEGTAGENIFGSHKIRFNAIFEKKRKKVVFVTCKISWVICLVTSVSRKITFGLLLSSLLLASLLSSCRFSPSYLSFSGGKNTKNDKGKMDDD